MQDLPVRPLSHDARGWVSRVVLLQSPREAHEWPYALVLPAKSGQRIRAEPFDVIELEIDVLFGADPTDDPSSRNFVRAPLAPRPGPM